MIASPVKTPHGDIACTVDNQGVYRVKMNDLALCLGYNKYLSLSHTRLGKYITRFDACRKINHTNWLDLHKVVTGVLPRFVDEFFFEVRQSDSRQQFFGNAPEDIYSRTKVVLESLKEWWNLCLDKNSPSYKKGKLGELLCIEAMKRQCGTITRLDGHPPEEDSFDVIDFRAKNIHAEEWLIEVKTRNGTFPFANGKYPCYSFPRVDVEAWTKRANDFLLPLELWIVDYKTGGIFMGKFDDTAGGLNSPKTIDFKEFPLTYATDKGDMVYFHQSQFSRVIPLTEREITAFRAIDSENIETPTKDCAPYESPITLPGTQPAPKEKDVRCNYPFETLSKVRKMKLNGKPVVLYKTDNDEYRVKCREIQPALGWSLSLSNFRSPWVNCLIEHDAIRSTIGTHGQKTITFNVATLIDCAIPAIVSGKIKTMNRVMKAAPIVLEDLQRELQTVTQPKPSPMPNLFNQPQHAVQQTIQNPQPKTNIPSPTTFENTELRQLLTGFNQLVGKLNRIADLAIKNYGRNN